MDRSDLYGPVGGSESIAIIRAALNADLGLIDMGNSYGIGHDELLVAETLQGRDCSRVQISLEFGALREPDGSWVGLDYTLRRTRTDYIDIYRPARFDPTVPIAVEAIADMVKAGYVRDIGLSEVGADTWRGAATVQPICGLMTCGIETTCRRRKRTTRDGETEV